MTSTLLLKGSGLDETTFAAALRPVISDAERGHRLKAVDFARGSVRYEGGIQTNEVEAIAARYLAGEIDSDELTAAILTSNTVHS